MKPLCVDCGETFSIRRRELGYRLCLTCGETEARGVKFCVVNMHKSNYVVVSNPTDLKKLNKYDNS